MHRPEVPSPSVSLSHSKLSHSKLNHNKLNHSRKMRWSALVIAVGAAMVGLGATIAPPASAQIRTAPLTQPPMPRTITVTGQCIEKIPATLADVQLGVEAQAKTAQEVQQEVARRSSAVVSLLKSRSVQKLQTTGINLNPQYRDDKGKQVLTGYQASNTVSFRVPTAQAGTMMDDAVKAGASRIDSISFAASEQAISDAQKVALRKAAKDAQEQAASVLSVLGLAPKEIVSIQLNGANAPVPMPYPMSKASFENRMADATTPVEAGEQSVQASVTLQISY
jgi:uncharacterized protein